VEDNVFIELALEELAAAHRMRADLLDHLSLSEETIRQSKELLKQADGLLARSPLKP
jgi:hypothetical protein